MLHGEMLYCVVVTDEGRSDAVGCGVVTDEARRRVI